MKIRKIQDKDEEATYSWVNDPDIRRYSQNKNWVSFEDHRIWFREKMEDPYSWYYILEDQTDKLVGSIRFDMINNEFIVSYLISPKHQGKGFGRLLVKMGLDTLSKEIKTEYHVVGWVYKINKASIRIFESLNFEIIEDANDMIKFGRYFHENR